MAAAKIGGEHAARAVHHRAARVARPHEAAQRRDRALHGPAPVGVLRQDRSRSGRAGPAARRTARPPGSRAPRPTCRARRSRSSAARARRRGPGARRIARSLRGSYQTASASSARALAAQLHRGVVLPRHHVSVRHHESRRARPSRFPARPSPHAVPSTRTTLLPAAPHLAGRGRSSSPAAARPPTGPRDRRERVEARERLEDRARRRQRRVQLLQDRGALDRLAQLARARGLERHRAARSRRGTARGRPRAAPPPTPSTSPSRSPSRRLQLEPERLEPGGEHAADQHGTHERG